MSQSTGRLRALVPGCVFEPQFDEDLEGVFVSETGVLNILTPGTLQGRADTLPCPLFESAEELPAWAQAMLKSAPKKMSTHDLLAHIVASTHQDDPEAPVIVEREDRRTAESAEEIAGEEQRFCLYWEDGELRVIGTPGFFEVERYDITRNIFSRNTGILETDIMASKRAVILGCGSVGSLVASELARAGVGNFLLVDMDLLEYHNICRHQCGVRDVGRRKPDVVRDLVLNINPTARVETFYAEVQQAPLELLESWCRPGETIVFGCADNREVDRYGNFVAANHGVAFLSIGFWERAFAGEVFYWLPGQGHACYTCALGEGDSLSQRVEANHHIYTSQTDLAAVNFEPGIAVDIDFVTIVGVKLALDIFNRDDPRFTQRLLPHLTQYTLICNTNEPAVGGEMAEIFSYPLQVTTSIRVSSKPGCLVCSGETR